MGRGLLFARRSVIGQSVAGSKKRQAVKTTKIVRGIKEFTPKSLRQAAAMDKRELDKALTRLGQLLRERRVTGRVRWRCDRTWF